MFTAKLTKKMVQDLSLVLNSIAPKDLVDLKSMRAVNAIVKKCDDSVEDVQSLRDELNERFKVYQLKQKEVEGDEAKKAIDDEATAELQPVVDKINNLGENEVEIEFSNDQIELVRNGFKKLVADKLKTAEYALKFADALGVEESA